MKRKSRVLEGKLTTASNVQTSQDLNNIMVMKYGFFLRKEYFSSYHECPLLLLKISSLPGTFCFHSSVLSCIVAVVQYVTINKNCEPELPAMMRQQID